jgi:hypothetical protein
MMEVQMDLRPKEAWKTLFETEFNLVNVQSFVMEYPDNTDPDDAGTLFLIGYQRQ